MSSRDQIQKRELEEAILQAMHTAIGRGMAVAEVAGCVGDLSQEYLSHSLLTGNLLKEVP